MNANYLIPFVLMVPRVTIWLVPSTVNVRMDSLEIIAKRVTLCFFYFISYIVYLSHNTAYISLHISQTTLLALF